MIGQCKSMYIGIVALAALLPAGTNKSRRRRALLTAALLGLSAASSLSWSLYTLQTYGQTEDNTFSVLRAGRRLATLLQRPLEYLGNMMNQLGSLSQYRHWITNQQMWGLGHIDHFWNYLPFFTAFTVLWAFTAARRMPCDAVIVFSRNERLMCMAIAMATALLLITAVQLFDAGAHLFDGRLYAQGRYFLPLWLLVWIAIHSPALHNPQVRLCLPELCIVAVLFLHLVAATN